MGLTARSRSWAHMRSNTRYRVAIGTCAVTIRYLVASVCNITLSVSALSFFLDIDMASSSGLPTLGTSSATTTPGTPGTTTPSPSVGPGFKSMLDQSVQEAVANSLTGFLAAIDARIAPPSSAGATLPQLCLGPQPMLRYAILRVLVGHIVKVPGGRHSLLPSQRGVPWRTSILCFSMTKRCQGPPPANGEARGRGSLAHNAYHNSTQPPVFRSAWLVNGRRTEIAPPSMIFRTT